MGNRPLGLCLGPDRCISCPSSGSTEPDGRKLGGKEAYSRLWLADHEPWEAGAQPNTWMLRGLPFAELKCLVLDARKGNFSCLQAEARGSLQVLLAIRDANPSSQLRSWWQGANYTAWRGVKAQDGEVVELCVLPRTPSSVYFMPCNFWPKFGSRRCNKQSNLSVLNICVLWSKAAQWRIQATQCTVVHCAAESVAWPGSCHTACRLCRVAQSHDLEAELHVQWAELPVTLRPDEAASRYVLAAPADLFLRNCTPWFTTKQGLSWARLLTHAACQRCRPARAPCAS